MEFSEFLQAVLPRLGLTPRRYNRKGVRRAVLRRMEQLRMFSFGPYQQRLFEDEQELRRFRSLLSVTITRFFRDPAVFDALAQHLVQQYRGRSLIRCWSMGCASGEEPYSLAILWHERIEPHLPGGRLEILATDINAVCLQRARAAIYPDGVLKQMPSDLRRAAFQRQDGFNHLAERYRNMVTLVAHDLLHDPPPPGNWDLVLCRNLVFTYFTPPQQLTMLTRLATVLTPGGLLVVGRTEEPPAIPGFTRHATTPCIWQWKDTAQ